MAGKSVVALKDYTASNASGPRARARAIPWPELDSVQPRIAWDTLAKFAAEPNPFHESWYLLPALRALDPEGSVSILWIEAEGQLIGLLPVRAESRYYGRAISHLSGWTHGNCFLGAPLVMAGMEDQFWQALFDWADELGGSSLFMHLTGMPLNGPVYRALQLALSEQGRHAGIVHREDRAMLTSPLSPQAYFETSLTGKKRKELRRQFARLTELGQVRFERHRDEINLHRWIDDFLALEHSGWKGANGSALLSHQSTTRLFRESLHGAAHRGRLERLSLEIDGEPIAMLVNFLSPPGAFSFKTAFDERFSRYSPGVLLQRENLDLLDSPEVQWCDSCAAADHPMIDHIWRERRAIGRVSIAIGGRMRRALFRQLLRFELRRMPSGLGTPH